MHMLDLIRDHFESGFRASPLAISALDEPSRRGKRATVFFGDEAGGYNPVLPGGLPTRHGRPGVIPSPGASRAGRRPVSRGPEPPDDPAA